MEILFVTVVPNQLLQTHLEYLTVAFHCAVENT